MSPFSSSWDRPDADPSAFLRRIPVRLRLADGRRLEGRIHIAEGQSLLEFLGLRRAFLNLTEVRWLDGRGGDAPIPHLGIRLSDVTWVVPLDPALGLTSARAAADAARSVEIGLDGETVLRVPLQIAEEQRMSDYFEANPSFLALRAVRVVPMGETLERVALNGDAIRTIRELEVDGSS